jgi:hypothetical protein
MQNLVVALISGSRNTWRLRSVKQLEKNAKWVKLKSLAYAF